MPPGRCGTVRGIDQDPIQRHDRPAEQAAALAYALARAGRAAEARQVIENLRVSAGGGMPPNGMLASALMVLGDDETAVAVLNAAVEQHDPFLMLVGRAARFDPLRSDARAHRLLRVAEGAAK